MESIGRIVTFDWQIVIVALAVLWAASVVLYRFRQLFRGPMAGGCHSGGGCHGCPSNQTASSSGLIQLGLPTTPKPSNQNTL